jgi:bacterioferritin
MVFGHNRIPIVSWLRAEATTCLAHANEAGELVTHFGDHPSLKIGALLETISTASTTSLSSRWKLRRKA